MKRDSSTRRYYLWWECPHLRWHLRHHSTSCFTFTPPGGKPTCVWWIRGKLQSSRVFYDTLIVSRTSMLASRLPLSSICCSRWYTNLTFTACSPASGMLLPCCLFHQEVEHFSHWSKLLHPHGHPCGLECFLQQLFHAVVFFLQKRAASLPWFWWILHGGNLGIRMSPDFRMMAKLYKLISQVSSIVLWFSLLCNPRRII